MYPENAGVDLEAVENSYESKDATQSKSHANDILGDFNRELKNSLFEIADSGVDLGDAFFEFMAARLEVAGEIDTADRALFEKTVGNKNIRIDGSAGDPRESDGTLSLIICDFYQEDNIVRINAAHAKRLFSYLSNFLFFAQSDGDKLQDISAGAGLAETISLNWHAIKKVKLILLTNALYSSRTDGVPAGRIADIPATYNIWDLARFHRYEASGQAREALSINFEEDFGGALPALAASNTREELDSYLAVIPGPQLAKIYEKWGSRLLESNVRSFLQVRKKVNQGIRDTIKKEPSMFFSYNNGLSATASSVQTITNDSGLKIAVAENLQIVNGGQTTASLHAAMQSAPAELAHVYVQMKLTIVPTESSNEIIPKISEYANSQNKVNAADFFSNHPFHIRIEEYSRRVLAPSTELKKIESKWFYERAHGQFLVERNKSTGADRKKFDSIYPKSQFFAKTDLAKADFSFDGKPDIVSKGAQKNFSEFAKQLGEHWEKRESKFDELWYRRLIAKLIIFRHLEKIIPKQQWYPGGYRANIVTYAIAKLSADANKMSSVIDLDKVWKNQTVSAELESALLSAAEQAAANLIGFSSGIKNVTEWAKKQACWESLRCKEITYIQPLVDILISIEESKYYDRENQKDKAILSGIEAQAAVVSNGAEFWKDLRSWGNQKGELGLKDDGILRACSMIPARIPSEKQCISALQILEKATKLGYAPQNETMKIKITSWARSH